MPYKRNPMRAERICTLARYVIAGSVNPGMTAGVQWFERILDDSANKRICVAEAFLAVDAILNLYMNTTSGLVVYERVVTRLLMEKLPFMATENILMESVKRGGDRQELHEALRVHSHAAAARVKLEGGGNDLIDRIAADSRFPLDRAEIEAMLAPAAFTSRAAGQVTEFLDQVAGWLRPETGITLKKGFDLTARGGHCSTGGGLPGNCAQLHPGQIVHFYEVCGGFWTKVRKSDIVKPSAQDYAQICKGENLNEEKHVPNSVVAACAVHDHGPAAGGSGCG